MVNLLLHLAKFSGVLLMKCAIGHQRGHLGNRLRSPLDIKWTEDSIGRAVHSLQASLVLLQYLLNDRIESELGVEPLSHAFLLHVHIGKADILNFHYLGVVQVVAVFHEQETSLFLYSYNATACRKFMRPRGLILRVSQTVT